MAILKYWKFIAGAAVIAALVAAYGYAHHKGYAEGVSATEAKVEGADAKARADVASLNIKLASQAAESVSEINALRAQIANQPANQKVVYVEVPHTVPGPVAYMPVVAPMFITVGAATLYDASLGLVALPAQPDALPSKVTVQAYETTTLINNSACLSNTQQLLELITWVNGITNRRH